MCLEPVQESRMSKQASAAPWPIDNAPADVLPLNARMMSGTTVALL